VQFAPLRNEILSKTGATLFLRAPKRHNDRATKEASTVMYDIDTKSQFLELRAKGCSLSRIAERLKVSQRTLVDWNRQEHEQIRTLRAIEWEALQEKILATHEQELVRLKKELDRLEAELAKRTVEHVSTENLYRLSALVRAEIRKVCQVPLPVEDAIAAEE
jgi:transcriptional regulator with XRE-family HTH domain